MNKVKRLLKYEWARICAYKKQFAVLAVAVLIIFAGLAVGFSLKTASPVNAADKAVLMRQYSERLENYREILQTQSDKLTESERVKVERETERLQFFLDTDTVESDYLSIGEYSGKKQGYEAFGFCVYFFDNATYVFMVLSVCGALWAFSVETRTGTIKNLLAATADRKKVFGVKTSAFALAVIAVPVLMYAILLIVCACVPNGNFLIYSGGYKAVSGLHIFAQLGIRNILVMLCVYAATLLCSVFFKPLVATLIPVLSYFGLAFLAMTVTARQSFVMLGITAFDAFNFFPVVGLHNYLGGFDVNFLVMAIVHIVAAGLCVLAAGVRFLRRDF